MYTDMYEIIDNKGTIYSGTEDEMLIVWEDIRDSKHDDIDFEGDVGLIQVIDIT